MSRNARERKRNPKAKRRPSIVVPPEPARAAPPTSADDEGRSREALFARLRSGAANVAGVTFQIAVTAYLLAQGRSSAGASDDVVSVTPEGFEDIDCVLRSGDRLHVQTKERGVGARAIAQAEVAGIVAHAAAALVSYPTSRLAIVTNGSFGSGLPVTGSTTSLLAAFRSSGSPSEGLIDAVRTALAAVGVVGATPEDLLARTHLVILADDLADEVVSFIEASFDISRSAATIICAELLRDLSAIAAAQREAQLGTAHSRSLTEFDALAARVLQAIDIRSLNEAIRAGVCEPANFIEAPPVDAAGFFAGVDVGPAHVAAGLDVVRGAETIEIIEGLDAARDVVIAGPSGSGKSALLWRTALLLRTGMRVLRVLRVSDDNDVELLVRHVRRQMPRPNARTLVVADNLGADRMAAWPHARSRLVEIDGVLLLASVRREDFTPGLSGSAVVVDPKLAETSARAVFEALEIAGMSTSMSPDEAVQRAEGLLMEFIAFVTTGNRLRDVLAGQVQRIRRAPLRRDALRLICGAHLLGSAVDADKLPAALGAAPGDVGEALQELAGEHLIVERGQLWFGLHDLRTETLFELLHASPPPSAAATYAAALRLLPAAAQGRAARRAAVRLARTAAQHCLSTTPAGKLADIQSALTPVADALADIAAATIAAEPSDDLALHLASLFDAADRLDTVAYVHTVLGLLEAERPAAVDLGQLAFLVHGAAAGLSFDMVPQIGRLARRLPDRASRCADRVAAAVAPGQLRRHAGASTIAGALRLCEAAEGIELSLSADDATEIYRRHVRLPTPPGAGACLADADVRAQLTATLSALAGLRGPGVAAALGPVEARLADSVASDAFGCSVRLHFEAAQAPEKHISELIRNYTYAEQELLVAAVSVFVRLGTDAPAESRYPSPPGSDGTSVNDQAVLTARRVFDACPELDRVDADVLNADLRTIDPDGSKRLRAGVVRRTVQTARSVAFQAGVAEALGAENWTVRLRSQAAASGELVDLLRELPRRLESRDSTARRREWKARVRQVSEDIANLPARPVDRQPVHGAASEAALLQAALADDEMLRRPDRAKSALEAISAALRQVAENLGENDQLIGLAGNLFDGADRRLDEARDDGSPVFSGVGDTLPKELDTLVVMSARLLTALDQPGVRRAIDRARGDLSAINTTLEEAASNASGAESSTLVAFLQTFGVHVEHYLIADVAPTPAWRTHQVLAVCDLNDWPVAMTQLQRWTGDARRALGLSGRVTILLSEAGELLPFGLSFIGGGRVLPIVDEAVHSAAHELGLPIRGESMRAQISRPCDALIAYSYEQIRHVTREASWSAVPSRAISPLLIADELRQTYSDLLARIEPQGLDEFRRAAVELALELCNTVANQDPRAGIAAELAAIDPQALGEPNEGSTLKLLNAIQVAALEADRGVVTGNE